MPRLPSDLDQQVKQYIASGHYRTEEDVLRDALRALAEEQSVRSDIRKGLQDLEAGRGRSLEEVDADLCRKHNIRHDP